jgi:hypothetical protein
VPGAGDKFIGMAVVGAEDVAGIAAYAFFVYYTGRFPRPEALHLIDGFLPTQVKVAASVKAIAAQVTVFVAEEVSFALFRHCNPPLRIYRLTHGHFRRCR